LNRDGDKINTMEFY